MLNFDPSRPPTCNIVVSKEGEEERLCGQAATQMVNLANPDNHSQIYAIVLVCDQHDHDLETGKALIAVAENGDRIGVSYIVKGGEDDASRTDAGG